jgi:hypothetical protein
MDYREFSVDVSDFDLLELLFSDDYNDKSLQTIEFDLNSIMSIENAGKTNSPESVDWARAFPHYFGNGAWAFEIGNFSDILSKLGILKNQCFMTQFF